jgi:RimJ/RimL family protein N-acetyltransferase
VLKGCGVLLKEVEIVESVALFRLLSRDEIAEVIAPPPASPADLASRIEAARLERLDGRGICFTLLRDKDTSPAGLVRVREMERGSGSAEWEFVLAPEHWGGGLFFAAAPLVIDFAFDVLGVSRLETRVSVHNGRGNGALRKIGAVQEGVLRQSLQQEKGWVDQALWTLLRADWYRRTGRPH